ncbi:MAG: hypothetical protein MK212_07340 [Saprospiraceae bacterium]|nr:hypothetical protein [Saprospiraceae bacterium]
MDKFEKYFELLVAASGADRETCQEWFQACHRDIRKALFLAFQPKTERPKLWTAYREAATDEARLEALNTLLHLFCPNQTYRAVANKVSKGELYRIDSDMAKKIKIFRSPPKAAELRFLFLGIDPKLPKSCARAFHALQSFGRESAPFLEKIQSFCDHQDNEVARNALLLIAEIPQGIAKSLFLFKRLLKDERLQFYVLSAMQKVYDLPLQTVLQLFSPYIQEYERLSRGHGEYNKMWTSYSMMRQIISNNGGGGLVLHSPRTIHRKRR